MTNQSGLPPLIRRRLIWLFLASSPLLFPVAWRLVDTPLEGGAATPVPSRLVLPLLVVPAFIAANRRLDGGIGPADPDSSGRRRLTLLRVKPVVFEAVAVLGVVAAVLTQDLAQGLPFVVLSLLGPVLYRPQD